MRLKHTRILSPKMKNHLISSAFLAPSFISFIVFYVLPFVVIIYYSMVDSPISKNFVFLDNFKAVLGNTAFQQATKNTVTFSAVAVPLAVIMALFLAIALEQKIPAKSQLRTIFLSPMMVPVASIVLIWKVFFHYNGSINEFLSVFGIQKIDWFKSEYSQMTIILLFIWKNLGYNMVLFMAALGNIPKDLLEVASIEGATPIKIFKKIKLRFLSPTILFVTVLSLINSFKVFREVYLLTGDHPYGGLYLMQHFMNNLFMNLDYQKISASSILVFLFMTFLIGILFTVENWYGKDVEG